MGEKKAMVNDNNYFVVSNTEDIGKWWRIMLKYETFFIEKCGLLLCGWADSTVAAVVCLAVAVFPLSSHLPRVHYV